MKSRRIHFPEILPVNSYRYVALKMSKHGIFGVNNDLGKIEGIVMIV